MQWMRNKQAGFSAVGIMLSVFLLTGIVTLSVVATSHKIETPKDTAITPAASVTAWNDFKDSGYAAASGISLKYPDDWKINISGVKQVGNTKQPTAVINERVVFLPSAESPKDEWNTCATAISADACGAAPGAKTINSKELTINGFAAYSATMQTSSGDTYHVTVIRGNTATSDGMPFVEFTTPSNNQAALSIYADIMASATFNN